MLKREDSFFCSIIIQFNLFLPDNLGETNGKKEQRKSNSNAQPRKLHPAKGADVACF
jgi:hypothetical protein